MKINFKPSPGIIILEEIKEEKGNAPSTSYETKGRITKAKIIARGENLITDSNAILEAKNYGNVGEIVYFMHYYEEGGVDFKVIDNVKYYFVKFQDMRSVI